MPVKSTDNIVRVADKPISNYITAVAFKLKDNPGGIRITAFGKNLEKAFRLSSIAQTLYPLELVSANPIVQEDASGIKHSGIEIELRVKEGT